MEIYSTTLWHLQKDVALSALSKDLTDMDRLCPQVLTLKTFIVWEECSLPHGSGPKLCLMVPLCLLRPGA